MLKRLSVLFFILLPALAFAGDLSIDVMYEPYRGQPLVVSISSTENADYFSVKWQDSSYEVPAAYDDDCDGCFAEFMLPTVYENSGKYTISVSAMLVDGSEITSSMDVTVMDKNYPKESLTVEPKYVDPGAAALERIAKERPISTAALKTFSEEKLWVLPLKRPRNSATSGVYGEQRVFNGVPKSKHGGMDFRGAVGEPIYCVADGKVILAADFYYNGKFVFVDHGQGVVTAYLHMSEIIAKEGDDVKKGDLLGKVGATGRVTGPHLHFSLFVQGVGVDPMPLFEQ